MSALPQRLLALRGSSGVSRVVRALVAVLFTLVVTGAIFALSGADPFEAYEALVEGSLGNRVGVTNTVMLASILILTALAFAIPARAQQWNIGGEGQLFVGALASVWVALKVKGLDPALLTVLSLLAGLLAGAFWAGIAGVLKVRAGANEVLTTLMLNFIAILAVEYSIAHVFATGGTPSATPAVPAGVELPTLWASTRINYAVVVALVAVLLVYVLLARTVLGLKIRATGFNPDGARHGGIDVGRVQVTSLVLGGAFAGLAGAIVVIGIDHLLALEFSPGYGFIGIAVAMLARSRPLLIVPVAAGFAVLTVGGSFLSAAVGVSSSVALVTQAVLVLMVLALWVVPPERGRGGVA